MLPLTSMLAFANIRSGKAKIRIQALDALQYMSPLSTSRRFCSASTLMQAAPVQELATQNGITEMLIRLKISEVRSLQCGFFRLKFRIGGGREGQGDC